MRFRSGDSLPVDFSNQEVDYSSKANPSDMAISLLVDFSNHEVDNFSKVNPSDMTIFLLVNFSNQEVDNFSKANLFDMTIFLLVERNINSISCEFFDLRKKISTQLQVSS